MRDLLLEGLEAFLAGVGLPPSAGGLGLKPEEIPAMAENAAHDPCLVTNPRLPTREQLEVLYAQSL